MQIFCLCLVKDESDIIEQTLRAATTWADKIFVHDNGSTDGTWETVLALSRHFSAIIPYKYATDVFDVSLRRDAFMDNRQNCQDGDWWCRLDADEFYPSNPRDFLAAVSKQYQLVWAAYIQYYLTDVDVRIFENSPELYDDKIEVYRKIRYYKNNWSEARFFRFDKKLIWDKGQPWPYAGAVYPHRIPMKHYQHRSPQQLQRRIDVRKAALRRGATSFKHERRPDDWRSRVKPAAELDYDGHDGQFVLREELMPKLPLTATLPPQLVNKLRSMKRYKKVLRSMRYFNRSRSGAADN